MNKKRKKKYKYWKAKHNYKKLNSRTKRKKKNKNKNNLKKYRYNFLKENLKYNKVNQEYSFPAPPIFSLMENPNETINYFNKILMIIKNKNYNNLTIKFLLEKVNEISIDALMYMLAITKNTKKKHYTKGSYPLNENAKSIFANSGFLSYVKSDKDFIKTNPDKNINIRVCNDSNENRNICKEINLILMQRYELEKKDLTFLYDILYEMMINTNEHAYTVSDFLLNNWYLYVELSEKTIKISFLDTGMGVPYTINKNFVEKLSFLRIKNDADLILSALNGEFKTSTKLNYRGKGLPKFTKFTKNKKISNFKIISGKGKVIYDNSINEYTTQGLDKKLQGTVYYFEINVNELKKEKQNGNNN